VPDCAAVQGDRLDAYLDTVLIAGREQRAIIIAEYDPAWPQRFELERTRIAAALGRLARRIEHVGSTAVPGLAAKPIVDLLVMVVDPDDEAAFAPALERAGYVLRVREPMHRMFRTPALDVHVHVWGDSDPQVERHLAFRDRLRASLEDRARYDKLKRALAQREWSDMNHYAEAKGPLIESILAHAWGAPQSTAGPIRPARFIDATAIAALLGELGYPTEVDDARARLERLRGRDDCGALVYVVERKPVGLVTYQLIELIYQPRPQCRITALVVRADHRRRGIARALIDAIESVARERDCYRLEVTTRQDRPHALSLYLACGFHERPRRLVKMLAAGDA
jgi:GrpB-like predicted nucleotidyltransferase (UPF0157 family)/GNAT superfamily N-acetyltransferase